MENRGTVYVEAQRLFRRQKHGMDVVALGLLNHFRRKDGMPLTVLVKDDEDACISDNKNLTVKKLKSAFYPVWEQWLLPAFLKSKTGILHCTGNTAPVWGKMPLLVTIHDLIFLEENYLFRKNGGSLYQRFGNFYRSIVVPIVARKAQHIITVSHFQRDLIMKRLNVPASKISVIYNGADDRFFQPAARASVRDVTASYGISTPYIFFLANTEPRKNTEGVLKAFALLCRVHPGLRHTLVIKGLTDELLDKKIKECGASEFRPRIKRLGYIPAEHLPLIYQGADVLWFPSFSEGFGLPIVEAMAAGVPVITSDVSVMPEIAGEAALYVNPSEPSELVAQTFSLFSNDELKSDLIRKGRDRARRFTWSSAASQLAAIYSAALNSTNPEHTFLQKLAIISPVLNKKIS